MLAELTYTSAEVVTGPGATERRETFFISPEGVVVGKISGPVVDSLILAQTIDRILAGERPGSRTVGETQTPGS